MFGNYHATKKDISAINEAIKYLWDTRLDFVFKDRSKISKTLIISHDSKFIYIWEPVFGNKLVNYKLRKIPHKSKIKNEWQDGWWAGLVDKSLKKFLPLSQPVINGGLLTPFIELQKNKKLELNPYITKESYLATIIHEFGHVYFGGYGKRGELSAFCIEYYASRLFWPKHIKKLDKFIEKIAENKLTKMQQADQHTFALLNAGDLIAHYPKSWPKKLLTQDSFD